AVACKRIWIDHTDWRPIFIKRTKLTDDTIQLIFHVPVPPLVIDTVHVRPLDNFGLSLFNKKGLKIPIKEISQIDDTTLQIIAKSRVLKDGIIWYGNNGKGTGPIDGSRGNLRDSQGNNIVLFIKNRKIRIDNWMPISKTNL